MIFYAIIVGAITAVSAVLGVLPSLPAIPSAVSAGGAWTTDLVSSFVGVLRLIFTTELLAAIMVVLVALYAFEPLYHTALWALKKIPILNIK